MSEPAINDSTAPLSQAAIGAVVALVRVCELYDEAVAHRAAMRATVASMLVNAHDGLAPHERSIAVAAAALADVDLVISRPLDPEAARSTTPTAHDGPSPLLGATLVSKLPGLQPVAAALEQHQLHWDGPGATTPRRDELTLPARVAAVADTAVGNPAAGYLPTWAHALRRCERLAGSVLDPDVCSLLDQVDLEHIEAPTSPSDRLHRLLVEAVGGIATESQPTNVPPSTSMPRPTPGDELDATATATTIKSAVAAAGDARHMLALFADTAQRMVGAAEVVVMALTPTALDSNALARVEDGGRPHLAPERLDDLREFSTLAELRAGTSIERPPNGPLRELILPIMVSGETWGVLIASRRESQPPFDAHDSSVLRHISAEAADAIASSTHWQQMERMALRDQLTGLANRHELYRVLDEIFGRPPLERVDCALIMCDVDGLKVVNDTLGHQAGDRLLIDAAAALRGAVRDPERTTICRIGGDEFCVVIDGGALLTAHDISDTIERLFARSAGSGPPRSISCGIAFAGEEIESRSALLRAADENQYQTKRARKAAREALIQQVESLPHDPVVDRRAIRD